MKTDHVLFIASGATLQTVRYAAGIAGTLPIRVELFEENFVRIL
jgi:ATP-dependent protease HslVU (ClpYQ) ATPase subunit